MLEQNKEAITVAIHEKMEDTRPGNAISFQSVSKRYQKNLPLLESVSLDLNYGEVVVIAGPSGSGKSTILQIACGLLIPDSGKLVIDGEKVDLSSKVQRNRLQRMRQSFLSYISQDDYLFETLNVEENVAVAFDLHSEERDEETIRDVLTSLGIEHLASREISEISAGERKRVSIARGMVRQPRILIMDEPTSSLDAKKTIELMTFFRALSDSESKIALLVASHDINEMRNFSDRIYEIEDSRLTLKNRNHIRE